MELSTTAYVILGMLAWGPSSGYDVKAVVDRSVRFFWAASYGQIYPELRRLSDAGLVKGAAEPRAGAGAPSTASRQPGGVRSRTGWRRSRRSSRPATRGC